MKISTLLVERNKKQTVVRTVELGTRGRKREVETGKERSRDGER